MITEHSYPLSYYMLIQQLNTERDFHQEEHELQLFYT